MAIKFRARGISRDARKLTRTLTLNLKNKKKKEQSTVVTLRYVLITCCMVIAFRTSHFKWHLDYESPGQAA